MKAIKVIISAVITLALIYGLNRNWGSIPALGKFLDPVQGFWQNASSDGAIEAELSIKGLQGPVTVVYDSMLIPHIFATNDHDLYMAQGYVTARYRLWQMEFQTHAAAGRISEIIGAAALDFDRTQRRIGMVFGAKNNMSGLEADPSSRIAIESYAEGVNAYISSLSYKDLDFEYKLLNYEPEKWTSFKSALLFMNMAKTLNMAEKDLENSNALALFGKPTVDLLYPDREEVGDPIVDNAGNWKFTPTKLDSVPMALPNGLIAIQRIERSDKDVGSNNWALSGSKTSTGSPMLCNDPHLTLSLPSIWYAVHLNAPGVNTMGVSLPGSPAVIIGFNDSIAWGMTNAQRDLIDYYRIQFKDSTKNEYMSDGTWKASTKVVEAFKVKGGDDFVDTVVYTHHGPVTYDESFHAADERKHIAIRWVSHDASSTVSTFYKLNRAANHADYMEALNHFDSPAQNFVFASVGGDIAMRIQGKFPVRRNEEGKYVLDGTKSAYEWQAYIPDEQNVMYKNPARGFASSANQYPVDATYPYYVTSSSYEAYRNRRINEVLTKIEKATPQDLMKLQFDTYNLKAAESLPTFLQALDTTTLTDQEQSAYRQLKAWNFYNDPDAEGASYYEAWWDALRPLIWDEMNNERYALDYPTTFTTIKLIKDNPGLSFFDIQATPERETAIQVLRKSFTAGVLDIEKWKTDHGKTPRWADFKDTFIGHLLRQEPLSVHVQHGGNHDIVNASTRTHGPSWRMVVSLEKSGVKAWGVYPGGQAGSPGSPYYDNMINLWSTGRYFSLPFGTQDKLQGRTVGSTQLSPEND